MVAPGGLYEFAVLPIWLIAKGFRSPVVWTKNNAPTTIAILRCEII